ncbi:hypothetical protein FHN55_07705 [Streptomyces sp. NP160]|nr:hypothetical protein FHN55_07705 [Streptomyces sp. NP160]
MHPHLLPLQRVVRCREGAVQVLGPVAGGSLADLLAERLHLLPGEVAVLVAGVGSALAVLHEAGLVHGEVCAEGVLLDHAGLPLLLGWGGARSAVPEGLRRRELRRRAGDARPRQPAHRPGDDVRDLARLGLQALGQLPSDQAADDAERRELAELLRAALVAEPSGAGAGDLARACWEVARPVPIGSPGSVAAPSGAAGTAITQRIRRTAVRTAPAPGGTAAADAPRGLRGRLTGALARHPLRWAGGLVALALVTGGAAALGAVPRPEPGLTSADPADAVHALADLRWRAVLEHDQALLDRVDVAGSEPARADARLIAGLAGSTLEGATARVLSAAVEARDGDRAWVRVVTEVSAHRVLTGDRAVDVPESGPVTSRLLLLREDGQWKVAGTA